MIYHSIYRDCFSTAHMRDIWSEQATIAAWLKVEQTLARCQAANSFIPVDAAEALGRLTVADLNLEVFRQDMLVVGRPIVGLVRQLRDLVGDHAPYIHVGTTTQDIMDTGLALQLSEGVAEVERMVRKLILGVQRVLSDKTGLRLEGRFRSFAG